MAEYIVSARKYRPDSFESLIGQDNIAQTLKNSISRDKLAHAYLFCGPRGVGKTSAARIFAKTINCQNLNEKNEPCGHCESCVSFNEGRSYCIHEMDAASNNSVDEIKTLIEQVYIPPQVGKYSVYIVDEVHMLSTAAFNAFLKTLEEPPAYAIFILATTEKHKIPATILSRCQTFDFKRITVSDIVLNLRNIAEKESITIDDESLHIIAMKSDGAMRDALTIFDQTVAFCGENISYDAVLRNLNVLDYEYSFRLVDYFLSSDYAKALLVFNEVLSKGFNSLYFVSALSTHFRNLLVAKTAESQVLMDLPQSLKQRYIQQASGLSLAFIYEALNICASCESSYKHSVNPRLAIEFALIKLCFIVQAPKQESIAVLKKEEVSSTDRNSAQLNEKSSDNHRLEGDMQEHKASEKNIEQKPQESNNQTLSSGTEANTASLNKSELIGNNEEKPVSEGSPVQEKAKRGRRPLKSTISLNNIAEDKKVQDTVNVQMEDRIPDDEEIRLKWKELAGAYASRPRLATAIAESILQIDLAEDHKRIVFLVSNQAQQQWLRENLLRELQTRLCELLRTTKISLLVDLMPTTEVVHKHMTQKERGAHMMNNNPNVKELVEDLNLDI